MKLTVAYDGTDFHGSQLQPGLRTVQGVLQQALLAVTGEAIVAEFAGRTDAGVHAAGQVVSLSTSFGHGPDAMARAINANTPDDLAVLIAEEVEPEFSARHSARQRWYRYTIDTAPVARPLRRRYAASNLRPLDVAAMNAAAKPLLGWHDFSGFGAVPNDESSPVRRLDQLEAFRDGDVVTVDIKGSAFLRHMARNLVSYLTGSNAPARGLCLEAVSYEGLPGAKPLDQDILPLPLKAGARGGFPRS
ncbi:MAG TPA: tRNA pseudouridine(38-40) synthase TruA [Chloroflexota bacterium]|nr:tRNA pseudouridine(38-40) synthase TruA [Chloroflexota bacterium]